MKARTSKRPKGPPRYVPTLTEVVPEELLALHSELDTRAQAEAVAATQAQAALLEQLPTMHGSAQLLDPAAAAVHESPQPAVTHESAPPPDSNADADAAGLPETVLSVSQSQIAQAGSVTAGRTDARRQWLPDVLEEAVVHRVMQRVDIGLDQRLREAIATVVLEQTRSLLPRLREEVESVVRQAVYEAVADEVVTLATNNMRQS